MFFLVAMYSEENKKQKRSRAWIALASLVVAVLGVVPAYVIFWDKPDLAYQVEIAEIPLPQTLETPFPDRLLLTTVQNVGRRPSEQIQGFITVGGEIFHYEIKGPNPAYGEVTDSRKDSQIRFLCSRLAPGKYPIKISVWYTVGDDNDYDIGLADSTGAARLVESVTAEQERFEKALDVLWRFAIVYGALMVLLLVGRKLIMGIRPATKETAKDSPDS